MAWTIRLQINLGIWCLRWLISISRLTSAETWRPICFAAINWNTFIKFNQLCYLTLHECYENVQTFRVDKVCWIWFEKSSRTQWRDDCKQIFLSGRLCWNFKCLCWFSLWGSFEWHLSTFFYYVFWKLRWGLKL